MKTKLATVWLFPGQGSQFVGMGHDLLKSYPPAKELLDTASRMADTDLFQLVSRGPDKMLTRTDNLQPALTAISLACCLMLEQAGHRPDIVAGHSLGEYAALYAAGVIDIQDALRLVTMRGKLMHEIAKTLDGGMLAVKGLGSDVIETLVETLATSSDILMVANYNSPTQTVLSGTHSALQAAKSIVTERGGSAIELNVSGPWHSPMLEPAAQRFASIVQETRFQDAEVPLAMNASGTIETKGQVIREIMERQLCSPVRWVQILKKFSTFQAERFVEVGPGKVLRGLLRGLPELASSQAISVDGPKAMRFLDPSERLS